MVRSSNSRPWPVGGRGSNFVGNLDLGILQSASSHQSWSGNVLGVEAVWVSIARVSDPSYPHSTCQSYCSCCIHTLALCASMTQGFDMFDVQNGGPNTKNSLNWVLGWAMTINRCQCQMVTRWYELCPWTMINSRNKYASLKVNARFHYTVYFDHDLFNQQKDEGISLWIILMGYSTASRFSKLRPFTEHFVQKAGSSRRFALWFALWWKRKRANLKPRFAQRWVFGPRVS